MRLQLHRERDAAKPRDEQGRPLSLREQLMANMRRRGA